MQTKHLIKLQLWLLSLITLSSAFSPLAPRSLCFVPSVSRLHVTLHESRDGRYGEALGAQGCKMHNLDGRRFSDPLGIILNQADGHESRRSFLSGAMVVPACALLQGPSPAGALVEMPEVQVPADLGPSSWLWTRLKEGQLVKKADAKLKSPDIYYPRWMYGLWKVTSTAKTVEAPLGEELFGRAGLAAAQKEIGIPLVYQARFRKASDGRIIADRPFNVDSISRAAMGDSAVLECYEEEGDANKLKMTLTPQGAGGRVFTAALTVTARDSTIDDHPMVFGCTETSRQTISAENNPIRGNVGDDRVSIPRSPTISMKDIEVIQVFSKTSDPDKFTSVQRICTFMSEKEFRTKLRSKELAGKGVSKLFEDAKTLPVDVRTYEINYELIRRPRTA